MKLSDKCSSLQHLGYCTYKADNNGIVRRISNKLL
jgi:hypothetical protein